MVGVLFVCTGNICRSPTAEGVFRAMVAAQDLSDVITVNSAGTGDWHVGEPPDERACETAALRGIDIGGQRARRVTRDDFTEFELILAMDRSHHHELARLCPKGEERRIHMFLSYAPELGLLDTPDPYFGSGDGFEKVFDMIEAGARGLLAEIRAKYI
jgi:low molecular weight protein-tyrosine phosphatase